MPYFPLQVTIPEPCSENWDAMTPIDEKRRHCAACDKTLTDFSCMTDRQIGQILRHNSGKLCGRFRRGQLDRPLRLNGPRRRRGFGAIAASAGLLLAAPAFGQGVVPEPTEQVETAPYKLSTSAPGKVMIKGIVTDENGETLIGVSILIKGTTSGAVTDIDGRFELKVPDERGVILELTYTGFETKEYTYTAAELKALTQANESVPTTYIMEDHGGIMGGIVVTCFVREKNTLLDNLMVHPVDPIYEAPDYAHRTKSGDWKDYWRDLFAKRKARRAERRAVRQVRRALKEAARLDVTEVDEVVVPQTGKQNLVRETFNLQASPNPFDQELRVTFTLMEAQTVTLSLLDTKGRLLSREKYRLETGGQEVVLRQNLTGSPSGVYLLRLLGEKGRQETIQLVR